MEMDKTLATVRKHNHVILFDTETVGLKKDDKVIELSAALCEVKDNQLEIVDTFSSYVNPLEELSEEIIKFNKKNKTGITQEVVDNAPLEEDVWENFKEFLKQAENPLLMAYNSNFDEEKLFYMADRCGDNFLTPYLKKEYPDRDSWLTGETISLACEDILKPVKNLMPNEEKYKLETISEKLGFKGGHHDALEDVKASILVVNHLLEHEKEILEKAKEPKEKIYLTGASFWSVRWNLTRLYLEGSKGEEIYYDFGRKNWHRKDKEDFNYDSEDIKEQLREKTGYDFEDLIKKLPKMERPEEILSKVKGLKVPKKTPKMVKNRFAERNIFDPFAER